MLASETELELVDLKGECSYGDIDLVASPGYPSQINASLTSQPFDELVAFTSCLLHLKVAHLPLGYQVGVRPLKAYGSWRSSQTGYGRFRLRYHFSNPKKKQQFVKQWKGNTEGQTLFVEQAQHDIFWSECNDKDFFIGAELISATQDFEEREDSVGLNEIVIPTLLYRRCSTIKS